MSRRTFAPTRRGLLSCAALAAIVAAPATVQAQGMNDSHGLAGARHMYEMVRDYVMATASDTPADLFAYRPTEEVRSLGQILGHVGNASFMFCSAALGESSPATGDLEENATKDALVTGLSAAFQYCDRAYTELSSEQLAEQLDLFGMSGSKLWVLIFNTSHTWEHYGNLVTYLRMNDIVPPSSRGGM
jgi:uncharacterized damage-inducible protein DinB